MVWWLGLCASIPVGLSSISGSAKKRKSAQMVFFWLKTITQLRNHIKVRNYTIAGTPENAPTLPLHHCPTSPLQRKTLLSFYRLILPFCGGVFSWWLSGKESACLCRKRKRPSFDPWAGKIAWSRKWQPTPYFCLENSTEQPDRVLSIGSQKNLPWLST